MLCSSVVSIANIHTPCPGLAQTSPFLTSWLTCTFHDSRTRCFSACCVLMSIPYRLAAPLMFQSTCFICIDVSISFGSFSGLQHLWTWNWLVLPSPPPPCRWHSDLPFLPPLCSSPCLVALGRYFPSPWNLCCLLCRKEFRNAL